MRSCPMGDAFEELFLRAVAGVHLRLPGHSQGIVLPVQKRDESREVRVKCRICKEETWLELPEDGFARFLQDLADGKII